MQFSLPGKYRMWGTRHSGEGAGPSRSLARLVDVLGSMGRVLVHGGVGLLVSHLGGRGGEVLVALLETQKEDMRHQR